MSIISWMKNNVLLSILIFIFLFFITAGIVTILILAVVLMERRNKFVYIKENIGESRVEKKLDIDEEIIKAKKDIKKTTDIIAEKKEREEKKKTRIKQEKLNQERKERLEKEKLERERREKEKQEREKEKLERAKKKKGKELDAFFKNFIAKKEQEERKKQIDQKILEFEVIEHLDKHL